MTVCAACGGPVDPDVTHVQHVDWCDMDGLDWAGCDCPEVCAVCCLLCRWQIDNFDLPERITSKIEVDQVTGCWLWTGNIAGRTGYAGIRYQGRQQGAHRVVYQLLLGSIPGDLELDHLCRVTRCVNPGHLEPVTHRENNRRSQSVSAKNAVATHCLRGHEFDEVNTYRRPGTDWRDCKACIRLRRRARAARRRETS